MANNDHALKLNAAADAGRCPGCGTLDSTHNSLNCDRVRCEACGISRADCRCPRTGAELAAMAAVQGAGA